MNKSAVHLIELLQRCANATDDRELHKEIQQAQYWLKNESKQQKNKKEALPPAPEAETLLQGRGTEKDSTCSG